MKASVLITFLFIQSILFGQLRWVSFSATIEGEGVVIAWCTTEEMDAEYFVVERSINGFDWFAIDTVTAKKQYGLNEYTCVDDMTELEGNIIYRASLVDKNGNVSISPMDEIKVVRDHEMSFTLIQTNASCVPFLQVVMDKPDALVVELISLGGYILATEQHPLFAGRQQIQLPVVQDGKPDQVLYRVTTASGERFTFQSIAM